MRSTVTATEARASLHDLLDHVERGNEVTITRNGRPVAVVLRPEALRSRRAESSRRAAAWLGDQLATGPTVPLVDAVTLDPARAEELIADIRSSRGTR